MHSPSIAVEGPCISATSSVSTELPAPQRLLIKGLVCVWQVSGVTFAFDANQPPGQRVVEGSVRLNGERLDRERHYTVGTKSYLLQGKDGFGAFKDVRPASAWTCCCIRGVIAPAVAPDLAAGAHCTCRPRLLFLGNRR
jgi:hypothetical protein